MHILNKRVGETPLELIRRTFPDHSTKKYTYAGRLDPMASGLMIILEGDEVHEKEQYLDLDKTYELEILFGVSTDSYDTLGLITDSQLSPSITHAQLTKTLDSYPQTFEQPYPPYSSRTVEGKPLWLWAKEGKLDQITIPTKQVTIHSLTLDSLTTKPLSDLVSQITSNIDLVKGHFRQDQIIKQWQSLLTDTPTRRHADTLINRHADTLICRLTVHCSSGTYMRSLAHSIGKQLGIPALALSIHRTRVGDYSI